MAKSPAATTLTATAEKDVSDVSLAGIDLTELVKRRHPEYTQVMRDHWNFCEMCYRGGRDWFKVSTHENLFRFYKEGEKEYKERKDRSHRANHTKRVVDTINQYLYRQDPVRSWNKIPKNLARFWKSPEKGVEGDINDFARSLDKWVSVFGRIYIVMDRPDAASDPAALSGRRADEAVPYAYVVFPQRVLDMAYDDGGRFEWILISEDFRPTSLSGSGQIETRWRLWTKQSWYLLANNDPKNPEKVNVIDQGTHGLGVVPVIKMSADKTSKWSSPALVGDIAYMDRTLTNYASMLDEIIYEQTFSQLTIPAEALLPGTTEANQLIASAKNRIFMYSSTQPGAKPEFISPNASMAKSIIDAMDDIKKDIYAITGTSNDANTHALETGKTYSSGRVREYDHTQIENVLLNKAREAERVEEEMIALNQLWMGEPPGDNSWVQYPDRFDVRGLAAELELAAELNELDSPLTLLRTQMKVISDKAFPRLDDDARDTIHAEIDAWKPGYAVEQGQTDRDLDIKELVAEAEVEAMKNQGAGDGQPPKMGGGQMGKRTSAPAAKP
jgi:hypothetical protein